MRKTWETINRLIKPNSGEVGSCPNLVVGGRTLSPVETCNAFNAFFVNIGPTIANSLPLPSGSYSDFLTGDYIDSFYFSNVSPLMIKNILLNIKNKNAPIDCLPARVLKYIQLLLSQLASLRVGLVRVGFGK